MATFVLVHGAFKGGWCYVRVARALRAAGHDVFTPTLTGLGERSHLLSGTVNLDTHIQDIVNVIAWENLDKVVLCGHSYGATVVTGVAEKIPEKIGSLVYIDGIIPKNGEAAIDMLPEAASARVIKSVTGHGGIAVPAFPSAAFGLNAADQPWVDGKSTPQPFATMCQQITLKGAHLKVPQRVFIYADSGPDSHFGTLYKPYAGEPKCTVVGIPDTGHEIMLDQPEALTKVLIDTLPR